VSFSPLTHSHWRSLGFCANSSETLLSGSCKEWLTESRWWLLNSFCYANIISLLLKKKN